MHGCELIELAALLATNARMLVRVDRSIRAAGLEEYWVASKCRLDRWGLALAGAHDGPAGSGWPATRAVVEEILWSDVLTRVWTAVCCGRSRATAQDDDLAAVARNVFLGHLEASARAMRLMSGHHGVAIEEAVALNRLRRKSERWNDFLLALCRAVPASSEFAHCRKRLHDATCSRTRYDASMLLAAVQLGCREGLATEPANPDSNRRISAAVLACIGPHAFTSAGSLPSKLVARFYDAATDRQATPNAAPPDSPSRPDMQGHRF